MTLALTDDDELSITLLVKLFNTVDDADVTRKVPFIAPIKVASPAQ